MSILSLKSGYTVDYSLSPLVIIQIQYTVHCNAVLCSIQNNAVQCSIHNRTEQCSAVQYRGAQ